MLTFNRALFNTLVQAKNLFKVVLVTGPRNSGKKSLLKAIFQDVKSSTLNYVSLEDPEERYFANHDPSGFIKKHKPPLLIAEIEYAPVL